MRIEWISEHLNDIESIIRAVGGIGTIHWHEYLKAMENSDVNSMLSSFNEIMNSNQPSIKLSNGSIPIKQSIHIINNTEYKQIVTKPTLSTDVIWKDAGLILPADDMNVLIDAVDAFDSMKAYDDIQTVIDYYNFE